MADWDGLREGLEGSIAPPPLSVLRERRRRRQQRRTIALACAVTMIGTASGVALLGRAEQRQRTVTAPPPVTDVDRIVNSDRLPPPADYEDYVVTDVDFVSPSTGWAIGLRCVGAECDVVTWRTADGGGTWSAPVPVADDVPRVSFQAEDPSGGAVRSLRMVDEWNGFAFNPDLYVTSDGARTWRRVRQPSKVMSVSVSGTSVWVAERGCAAGVDCDLAVRTGEVGGALAPLKVPQTNGAAAVVRRAGGVNAYLLAWDAPDAPHASFYRTRDGGLTWHAGAMPCPDATAASLSAGAGRPLWVVCTTPGGRRTFQSADHGSTWRRLADPPSDGVVTDLVARSANDAYLATQVPGALYVTGDGGATWRAADGIGTGYGYSNLDVADATHVWAMGDAGWLWRTTDGTRWERLALPPGAPRSTATPSASPKPVAPASYTGVWFTDRENGWALGRRCVARKCLLVLRRSADGGDTWTDAHAPDGTFDEEGGGASSVVFADARIGYLYNPGLFMTADGGATWRELPASRLRDLAVKDGHVWTLEHDACGRDDCRPYVRRARIGSEAFSGPPDGKESPLVGYVSLAVASGDTAYVVESEGFAPDRQPLLLATTDGGRTWTRRTAPCADAITRRIAATGGDLWLMCGLEGGGSYQPHRSAHSADGGATWTVRAADSAGNIDRFVALSPLVGWRADGGISTSFKTTRDGGRTWTATPFPSELDLGGGARAFQLVDEAHGLALLLEENSFLRTTDGRTWRPMPKP